MAIEQLNDRWANASADGRKVFEEEGLILHVTEEIWKVMHDRGVNKAQLAEMLGRSKSYVTQLLNGSRNMTLRTLADICFALSAPIRLQIGETRHYAFTWDSLVRFEVHGEVESVPVPSFEEVIAVNDDSYEKGWDFREIKRVAA